MADFAEYFGADLLPGERIAVKHRIPKRYRIEEIDLKLRKERTVRGGEDSPQGEGVRRELPPTSTRWT